MKNKDEVKYHFIRKNSLFEFNGKFFSPTKNIEGSHYVRKFEEEHQKNSDALGFVVKKYNDYSVDNSIDFLELAQNECRIWNKIYPEMYAFVVIDKNDNRNFRFVMPYLESDIDLNEILQKKNSVATLNIQLSIAKALDELHKKGITHGDLHRGNILIKETILDKQCCYKTFFIDFEKSKEKTHLFKYDVQNDCEKFLMNVMGENEPEMNGFSLTHYIHKIEKKIKKKLNPVETKPNRNQYSPFYS